MGASLPFCTPRPLTDEVHVWRFPLDLPAERRGALDGWLSSDERERRDRYVFDRDRDRFVVARGRLREVLASYIDLTPGAIRFSYTSRGKPSLARSEATHSVTFSVSHSADVAVMAIARDTEIGVDVEHVRDNLDLELMTAVCLTRNECDALDRAPQDARRTAFFRAWTQKEAFLKATGDGLSRALHSFEVSIDRVGLLSIDGNADAASEWSLVTLDAGPDCASTLATTIRAPRVLYMDTVTFGARGTTALLAGEQ